MGIRREVNDFIRLLKGRERIPLIFKIEICLLIIFEIIELALMITVVTFFPYLCFVVGIYFIYYEIKRVNKFCIKKEKVKKIRVFPLIYFNIRYFVLHIYRISAPSSFHSKMEISDTESLYKCYVSER